jgi:mannose-6-phosphate isomerase-like protein (cupin superfamily)
MDRIDLRHKLSLFTDHWNPRVVGDVNECQIKLAKLKGEFVWHSHANEDEAFLVLAGHLTMRFRDRIVELSEGQMIIVPRGVEHQPYAAEECSVMLIEPKSTLNTGNAVDGRRREHLDRI